MVSGTAGLWEHLLWGAMRGLDGTLASGGWGRVCC